MIVNNIQKMLPEGTNFCGPRYKGVWSNSYLNVVEGEGGGEFRVKFV